MQKNWHEVIGEEKEKDYFQETLNFVRAERESGKMIYPSASDVFNAFKYTEFSDVKVVILGQDPYHGPIKHMACAFQCNQESRYLHL